MKEVILMGNGPSLNELIEFGLHNIPPHIDTMALNSFYRYSEEVGWYPTYLGSFDSRVTPYHADSIIEWLDNPVTKKYVTCTCWLPEKYHNHPKVDHRKDHRVFNPEWYTHNTGFACSGHTAIKFLMSQGYDKIYLIGVDANYKDYIQGAAQDSNGGLYMVDTPDQNPNYFWNKYQQKGDKYNVPGKGGHIRSWEEVSHNIQRFNPNIDVVNLSKISEVPFFRKSSIDKELV